MNVEKIEDIEKLISLPEGSTIVDQTIKRLTEPGGNYGSLMLSVDLKIQTKDGHEKISVVAKMVPPNEFLQQVFNTQVTFRNEIGFYKNVVPTLREFQREQGMQELIDFCPKYFGSRINLTGDSTKVDANAVLLLENLKLQNYENIDKTVGFDLETSKLIINDMARLHAVPIALKLKKPEVFDREVKTFLKSIPFKSSEEGINTVLNFMENVDACKRYLQRIKAIFQLMNNFHDESREPFATISHNDIWVNNTMIKMEEGRPINNKLVDFQVCSYSSPAKDLIFFLFSSLQNNVLVRHCDDLIKYYHEKFIKILEELDCNTNDFSYESFVKEIELEAPFQFLHTIFMFFPIFMPKSSTKELDEFTESDFMKNADEPSKAHLEKTRIVVEEFVKRNWI